MSFHKLLFSILILIVSVRANGNYVTNLENVINLKAMSPECLQDILSLDVVTQLKMLDASTKIPTGILYGSLFDLGNFDECYTIQTKISKGDIYGKYCIGTLSLGGAPFKTNLNYTKTNFVKGPRMLGNDPTTVGFHFAICIPHTCTAQDISGLLLFTEEFCQSEATAPEFDTGAIAATVVLGIFIAIAAISTIYDVYLYYNEKKAAHELLIAFSFLTNGRQLFKTTKNPSQLLSLNGIKAISMMWVILGHTFSNALAGPLQNLLSFYSMQDDPINMYMLGAGVSVDTFFFVGGLVTVYVFLKAIEKGVKFNIGLYYLHRYLRLTPAYAVIILINAELMKYFGNGPVWPSIDGFMGKACRKNWWANLLYIQNYVDMTLFCLGQGWYLCVDMQYFLLSPIVLIPLKRWPKKTLWFMYALAVAGIIVPFLVGYFLEINAYMFSPDSLDFMQYYYAQAYARFGPYVIGMICGYYVYQFKKPNQNLKLSVIQALAGWVIALAILLACLFAGHDMLLSEYKRLDHSFYLGFNRPCWAIGLALVVILCETGHGSFIHKFLGLPVFQLLTKLSYSMFLVHFMIIMIRYGSSKVLVSFSNIDMMFNFWGYFMFTAFFSVLLCLMFESPIIILEKHIFGRGKTKGDEAKKPQA